MLLVRWIPDSRYIGFQITCQWNLDSGFLFIVTVTDSWFPSGAEKRIPKPMIPGLHKQKWLDSFFLSKDYLSCVLLYHFVFLYVSFFVLSFFFAKRELMPDIILIIFFTFIPLSLHQVRKDIGHKAIALPFLHLVITVNPLLSPLSQINALFNNPGPLLST